MSQNWTDLKARMISALVMLVVGFAAIVAGGVWFQMLAVFATAIMVWELWLMIAPNRPTEGMLIAALVAVVLSGVLTSDQPNLLALVLLPPLAGAIVLEHKRAAFFVFALLILLAGWTLVSLRDQLGMSWIFWLLGVVIVTDIAGYFAGRSLGGPKFWPAVSPKKTWSGTIAGWIGAAVFGALIAMVYDKPVVILAVVSVCVSFASQLGDIGESALKRRMGVKDSSALIPGHGGLFDRFDGVLGAALAMLLASQFTQLPEISL